MPLGLEQLRARLSDTNCVQRTPRRNMLCLRRSEIDSAIRGESRATRAVARRTRAARKSSERAWQLSNQVTSVALIIYILTNFAVRPAAVYLKNCGRSRHWVTKSDGELDELVEACFLCADPAGLMR